MENSKMEIKKEIHVSQPFYQLKTTLVPVNHTDTWCLRNQLLIKSLERLNSFTSPDSEQPSLVSRYLSPRQIICVHPPPPLCLEQCCLHGILQQ